MGRWESYGPREFFAVLKPGWLISSGSSGCAICWDFFDGYLEAMLGHAGIMFGSCWIKNVSRHLVNLYTESCFFWSFSFLFVLILNRTKQWKSDESWQDAVLYLPGNLCDEFASRGIVPDGGLTVAFLELAGI